MRDACPRRRRRKSAGLHSSERTSRRLEFESLSTQTAAPLRILPRREGRFRRESESSRRVGRSSSASMSYRRSHRPFERSDASESSLKKEPQEAQEPQESFLRLP